MGPCMRDLKTLNETEHDTTAKIAALIASGNSLPATRKMFDGMTDHEWKTHLWRLRLLLGESVDPAPSPKPIFEFTLEEID